jgi:hypothetical protein
VRAIHLDKYEAINGIDRGILERLLNASRSADGARTQASQGQRRKTIQTAAAGSLINELIPKFDEDTSLAVNGATDVNSAADVSRVFDAAVGYPAATAAGESVYPVSGR